MAPPGSASPDTDLESGTPEVEAGTMAIDEVGPVSVLVLFQDAVEDFGSPISGTRIIVHCTTSSRSM